MQSRATVVTQISSEFMEDLERIACERHLSVSAFVREALSVYMYGKAVPLLPQARRGQGNRDRDGREAEALTVITANEKLSTRRIAALLKDRGIHRGRDWVSLHRRELQQNV